MIIGVAIWSILAIEFTLKFNLITGVYAIGSTGQIIPFIIEVVSMGRMLNLIGLQLINRVCNSPRYPLATITKQLIFSSQHYPNWAKVEVTVDAQNHIAIYNTADEKVVYNISIHSLNHS